MKISERILHMRAYILPLLTVGILLLIWEFRVINMVFGIPDATLPKISTIISFIIGRYEVFLKHASITLYEGLASFGIGAGIGIFFGSFLFHSRIFRNAVYPILILFNSVPKSAIAPLFIIWFGVGQLPAITLGALIAFFPVMINMFFGLESTKPELIELARSLKSDRWKIFTKIRFPNALPQLFTGLKIAGPLALVGAVVSEMVASDSGLGYLVIISQQQFTMPLLYGGIMFLLLMGLAFFAIPILLEKFIVPWSKK